MSEPKPPQWFLDLPEVKQFKQELSADIMGIVEAAVRIERAALERLRGLLEKATEENDGAPSGHCCANCPWCAGNRDWHGTGLFVHKPDCPVYTPEGKVKP